MSELEWRAVTPDEFISELEEAVTQRRENKYAFQVGLKDLGFEIDEDQARAWGVTLPFQSIDQAVIQCKLGSVTFNHGQIYRYVVDIIVNSFGL